jgi:DNA-binding Xre family transcriptional regulator
MASADRLIEALKRVLKTRGITYAALAEGLSLSEASVKRLFSERTFTLQRLDDICRLLELDLFELARLARGEGDSARELSEEQEALLAGNRKLLGLFYLLLNNWQTRDIVENYRITEPECIRLLIKLDRAGLIELLPGNRVRLRVSRQLRYRPKGPIRMQLGELMVSNFLSVRFDDHGGHFRFEVGELSPASAAILQRKLDRLAAEFFELAELDHHLPPEQRTVYGIAAGLRPWSAGAEISGLQRREPA